MFQAPDATGAKGVVRELHAAPSSFAGNTQEVQLQPLTIRLNRIVDFGVVVSLIGIDVGTNMPVSLHVDHRPFPIVRKALRDAGLPLPIEYAARRLLLHLNMRPVDARESSLVEQNGSGAAESVVDLRSVLEQDR